MVINLITSQETKFFFIYIQNETYLAAVNTSGPLQTISLMAESVFISEILSQVFTFHKRMMPPRQLDNRMSSDMAIPDTQPLCALFKDCKQKQIDQSY